MSSNKWKTYKVSDLGKVVTGKTPPTKDKENFGKEFPFITPVDMKGQKHIFQTQRYLSETGKNILRNNLLPTDTICVSCIGSDLGKVVKTTKPSLSNQQINSIICNDKFDNDFVFYALKNISPQLRNVGHHSTAVPIINKTDFSNFEISAPTNKQTQKKVASILCSLDNKIELNKQINETLETILKTLFNEWFVSYNYPNSTGEMQESKLGKIPKNWRVGNLEEIILELKVGSRPKGGVKNIAQGVISIGAENILKAGEYDFSKNKFIPKEFFEKMTKGKLKHKDILIYKDGGKPGDFKPHISMYAFDFPFQVCTINEHVYRLQTIETHFQYFLYLWLNTDFILTEMNNKGTGAAIPGLNSTALKSLTLLIPETIILQKFDSIISPLFEMLFNNSNQIVTLTKLRDSFLPKLLNGEINLEPLAAKN